MINIEQLWLAPQENHWKDILEKKYWDYVKPENKAIEGEFQNLNSNQIKAMDAKEWYNFLETKYFKWKYTAPNRYATTTKALNKHKDSPQGLENLHQIKNDLFSFNTDNISFGLKLASSINGLGVAGASGLLAVLFPEKFGTVDQFVAKALEEVHETKIQNAESLTVQEGVALIEIMRRKAIELNELFKTSFWTPRKIDQVLWVTRQN